MNELVYLKNDEAVCSSLLVAEKFEKRLCPACFTELAEEANYCPICGKCMRDAVEQISQYIGEAPITTVVEIKDCAIRIGMKK